jgi:methylglyoxal/glyoxal reductase
LIHFPGNYNAKLNADYVPSEAEREKARKLRLETWQALEELYNQKKCRAIGVSNFMKHHLDDIIDAGMITPMINQCEFHPYYTNQTVYSQCKELGIQFEGYCPLGKGAVLNDPLIEQLATKYSKTKAQIAIKWSIQVFLFSN